MPKQIRHKCTKIYIAMNFLLIWLLIYLISATLLVRYDMKLVSNKMLSQPSFFHVFSLHLDYMHFSFILLYVSYENGAKHFDPYNPYFTLISP